MDLTCDLLSVSHLDRLTTNIFIYHDPAPCANARKFAKALANCERGRMVGVSSGGNAGRGCSIQWCTNPLVQ